MTLKHTVLGVGSRFNSSVIQSVLPSLWPRFPQGWAGEEWGKSPADAGSLHRPPGQALTLLPPPGLHSQSEPADHKQMYCVCLCVSWIVLSCISFTFLWLFGDWIRLDLHFTMKHLILRLQENSQVYWLKKRMMCKMTEVRVILKALFQKHTYSI